MTNTQKLIQAQRELIKMYEESKGQNIPNKKAYYSVCRKLIKKIASLEKKIISEETIKK